MDRALILMLIKARLGITSEIRDEYIRHIINGVIDEVERIIGVSLDGGNSEHQMFCVDYAAWRYQSVDQQKDNRYTSHGGVPRHLSHRLHNLIVSNPEARNGN